MQERDFAWAMELLGTAVTGETWQSQWLAGAQLTWEELVEVGCARVTCIRGSQRDSVDQLS